MKKKILSWIKIFLINISVLFVIAILLDRIIPIITGQKPGIDRHINIREHDPLSSYKVKSDTASVLIKTDKNGLILGDYFPKNDKIDFVFIGGSTTECFYVNESLRFPFYSIEMLNKKKGTNFYGYNAGFGGSNLMHSYLILITKLLELKPRKIILMNAVNDFSYLMSNSSYFKGSKQLINTNSLTVYSFLKKVKDNLFPNLYRSIRSVFLIKNLGQIPGGPDVYSQKEEVNFDENLKEFSKILNLFIETCHLYEIDIVLMTQFNNLQNLGKKKYFQYNRFNDLIRKTSYNKNIKLIDLDSLVPKNFEMMYDGIHLTNKGSIFVSKIISEKL